MMEKKVSKEIQEAVRLALETMAGEKPRKRILKLKVVLNRTGRSRSSCLGDVKDGKFPPPIRLGQRSVGWLESEVEAWIDARITESRGSVQGGE